MAEIVDNIDKATNSSTDSNTNELVNEVVIDSVKEGLQHTMDTIVQQLEKKEFFDELVKSLNDNIDIPMINEKTEEKVFEGIVNCCILALKKIKIDD
tara:strand:- start:201 stop:491 length:291 start_codon:yes stop_codon:yes gene_type:complete